jgi:hypothetical protein
VGWHGRLVAIAPRYAGCDRPRERRRGRQGNMQESRSPTEAQQARSVDTGTGWQVEIETTRSRAFNCGIPSSSGAGGIAARIGTITLGMPPRAPPGGSLGPGASKGNTPVTSTPPSACLEGGRCAHVDGLHGIIFGPPPVRDGGGQVEGVAGVELEVSSPL